MASGGKRLGAGRKNGTSNQQIKRIRGAMKIAGDVVRKLIPDAFEGDSHALLVAVYKDPRHPLDVRIDCAKIAIRYEKPSLQAVEHTGAGGGPIETVRLSDREAARRITYLLTKKIRGQE